ncbi:MAG: peroxiredoxin [Planctomycetota bacterium]
MLKPGSIAPDFTLHDDTGSPRALSDLLQAGPLVVYFYPADVTPVCTKQACTFRDDHSRLVEAGVSLVGISAQGESSHAKFRARFDLPFPLLADTDKRVIRAYEALGPLGLVWRISYLVMPDGTIADAVRADLSLGKHRAFIERAIAASTAARAT